MTREALAERFEKALIWADDGDSAATTPFCAVDLSPDERDIVVAALRAPSPRGTIPTCCVTGAIPGDGGACGDCDPCIMGEPLVPEAVKRLIAEKNSLICRIGELEDAASASPTPASEPVAWPTNEEAAAHFAKNLGGVQTAYVGFFEGIRYAKQFATPPSPSAGREEIVEECAKIADRYAKISAATLRIGEQKLETPISDEARSYARMIGAAIRLALSPASNLQKTQIAPSRTEGGQAEGDKTDGLVADTSEREAKPGASKGDAAVASGPSDIPTDSNLQKMQIGPSAERDWKWSVTSNGRWQLNMAGRLDPALLSQQRGDEA